MTVKAKSVETKESALFNAGHQNNEDFWFTCSLAFIIGDDVLRNKERAERNEPYFH